MSRLDDLIDLIQTTNEVYFITAPGRVRTAYILVDDIVELALKTFLQERALEQRENCQAAFEAAGWVTTDKHRSSLRRYFEEEIDDTALCISLGRNPATTPNVLATLQSFLAPFPMLHHWSANDPSARNTFDSIIDEVKVFFPNVVGSPPLPAIALLDEALARHKIRNKFYHDHQQTGLTIDDDKCLRALCDMFNLMEYLFPAWPDHIRASNTVRCQIGVLRLKRAALAGQSDFVQLYNDALKQLKRNHRYDIEHRSVEHSLIHTVSDRFFWALREEFTNRIAELQNEIRRIQSLARQTNKHRTELANNQYLLRVLQPQLDEINTLLGQL